MGLERAKNNRYYCTCCMKNIKKNEKFFHDGKSFYRNSHTVNICYRCITGMFLQADVPQEEVNLIKNEIMINRIEGGEDE